MSKKKKTWVWNKETPIHAQTIGNLKEDMQELEDSHLRFLGENSKNKDCFIDDEPSIYYKSAVLMLCASWEAFNEDLVKWSAKFMLENCKDPSDLPKSFKKFIAKQVENNKNELAPWSLAQDKWVDFSMGYVNERVDKLHNPKSNNLIAIFNDIFEIDITDSWSFDYELKEKNESHVIHFDSKNILEFFDTLINIRGAYAHGRKPVEEYKGFFLLRYIYMLMLKVSTLMHNDVSAKIEEITNSTPTSRMRINVDFSSFIDKKN